ncbi:hypothetical protein BDF21DRAFT_496708 [Thamnidium elegans]|uniref:Uncharacterized protein n=1 Tax=Thamnidium elegans TaxID=101142 RepID=A0A8H7VU88_9FUNG|nr:hypothetical protein INT48_006378 [Thamnidium elegans]KAI8063971.1 hypothetical protein BDF21DRAFT_496708 [Thamnidium elegans]
MDPYRSHPPPSLSGYQPYMGTPHRNSLSLYQTPGVAPYPMPNDFNSFPLQQMYTYQPPPSYPHYGGMDPHYRQQLLDDEPSCFDSLLENICCCFGFGPQNHHEVMYRHDLQGRRLIAKEERNRMAQYQKKNQRIIQLQQQRLAQQSSTVTKPSSVKTTAATVAETTA